MKTILILALIFASAIAAFNEPQYRIAFTRFMAKNQRSYDHDEFQQKYAVFKSNMDIIAAWNNQDNGVTLKMNQFGDLTSAEWSDMYLGFKPKSGNQGGIPWTSPRNDLPVSYNWTAKGAVTPVKNQQQCGSCWAFSTTGSTEGCHQITTGDLVGLSEQNLVDCSTSQGNTGCDGGLMTDAMTYIITNGGIDTEISYPYTAEDGTCAFNAKNVGATLKNFTNIPTGSESDLQQSVSLGPTSVAIDASQSSFQFYSSGVYYDAACSSQSLDHGVLAVGWGTDPTGGDYWLVKNSWGEVWGLDGYIWMSRNKNNNCGIATMATLPIC